MELRPLAAADVPDVVRLWHATKRATYGFLHTERGRTLDDDDVFFRAQIVSRCAIWLAVEHDRIAGFVALVFSYVDRLYVATEAQRRGVGAALFAKAQQLSPAGLELHTHVKNHAARAFYERQHCKAVRFGISPPPENEPDVEYHWRPAR
jgi:ribosomal protein S18 acetylase RimI-like enzyme